MNYAEMKLDELKEIAAQKGITKFEKAKNPHKPNKTEVINAILAAEKSEVKGVTEEEVTEERAEELEQENQDEFLKEALAEATIVETEETEEAENINIRTISFADPRFKRLPDIVKKREQERRLFPFKRVLITSNQTNQTQHNLIRVTWGNTLIGHQTDNVLLGKPWHVRVGALNNLKEAETTKQEWDEIGNKIVYTPIPAYNIVELEPLTEAEIKEMAKKQTVRNAAVEAMK